VPAFLLPILLKYGIPFIIIATILGYGAHKVHENGKQSERVVWQKKALEAAEAANVAMAEVQAIAAFHTEKHRQQLKELTDVKKKSISKLERDVAHLSNRGLFIPASACTDNGTAEATGASGSRSTSGRIRLPEETSGDLISLAEDAQKVVIQYEGCRTELKTLVDVLPETD